MSNPLSPGEAKLLGRIGGLRHWADRDLAESQLASARRRFEERFATEGERKEYFARLALASLRARRAKKGR